MCYQMPIIRSVDQTFYEIPSSITDGLSIEGPTRVKVFSPSDWNDNFNL